MGKRSSIRLQSETKEGGKLGEGGGRDDLPLKAFSINYGRETKTWLMIFTSKRLQGEEGIKENCIGEP